MKSKMLNKDVQRQVFDDAQELFVNALQGDDVNEVAKAQVNMFKIMQDNIIQEAKSYGKLNIDEANDVNALALRGLQPLTTEERTFYNAAIDNGGFEGLEKIMPTTTINRVFEELRLNRPLLYAINFVNTSAVTEWIIRTSDTESAWWGPLCDEIKKKLSGSFDVIDISLYKLSAYIPVCKAMLDLGPEWLDRFVREILAESIAMALETAIISGTGKTSPIGMLKDLDGAVVSEEYPDKKAVELLDFTPKSLGSKVMAPLTKEGKRAVANVLIIVNPVDYWEKIFAETTQLSSTGSYVYGVLPIPATIIQSPVMPKGKMVAGIANDYFMGIGGGAKIEYSDHYQFLEDHRVYITKQYANGRPKDNKSFIVYDISKMNAGVEELPEV